jgi:nucleoside-diphosphate-sugar epimerase
MSSSLVIGGAGALGKAIVKTLQKNGTKVVSLDFNNNIDACHNIIFPTTPISCHKERLQFVNSEIKKLGNTKFNSIFSVAGSWRGGTMSDDDFMENIEGKSIIYIYIYIYNNNNNNNNNNYYYY